MDNRHPVSVTLSEQDYGALSLWCAVNSDSRRSFASSAVSRAIKNKIDIPKLKRRLKLATQEEWDRLKDVSGWHTANVIAKFKEFKEGKRIEWMSSKIDPELVKDVISNLTM